MKRLLIAILILAAIGLLPLILQDRTLGEGQLILVNEAEISLDRTRIEESAKTLTGERAVVVAIYIVSSGTESDFKQRLRDEGLMNGTSEPEARIFAIYIGISNRYSEIGWGSALSSVNGSQIRREILNSRLQEGDYTGAIVNALNTAAARFDNPYSLIEYYLSSGFEDGDTGAIIFWIILCGGGLTFFLFLLLPVRNGSATNSGTSSSYTSSYDNSSSWDSGSSSDSGSSDSGGGFDGGSWDD